MPIIVNGLSNYVDIVTLNGETIDLGSDITGLGTQRITLATDDACIASLLSAMSSGTERVQIYGVVAGNQQQVKVDASGRVFITADGILTVQATNLSIRALTSTDVVTVTGGAGQVADVKVTLDGESVKQADRTPIAKFGHFSGTSGSDQTLATWTVTGGKTGYLKEISFSCRFGEEDVALFSVSVNGVAILTTQAVNGAVSLQFDEFTSLPAAAVVFVKVKSDGATTIHADGSITGSEV